MNTLLDANSPLFEQQYHSFLFENDFVVIFPEMFLCACTLYLLVFGVIYSTSKEKKFPLLLQTLCNLGLLCILCTGFLTFNNPIHHSAIFYHTFVIDEVTFFLKVCILLATFVCVCISMPYLRNERMNAFEYIILICLSTCSMCLLVSSADFLSLYLTIEFQSLCFYVLAAWKRNSEFSTEAGLKYFLLGAFSSGLLLFGCSLIYGFTGISNISECALVLTCDIHSISHTTTALRACECGMIFLLVGFLFKLTVVPFHMWAPDVYEGAPTSVTAFFAITPKIALVGMFLRLLFEGFYEFFLPWQKILIVCSIASLLVASLAAMSQNKIKRLLAFSSIGHMGYLLIGCSCGTIEGLQAVFIYLVVYITMTTTIFAFLLSPVRRHNVYDTERMKYITDFSMLSKTNPVAALTMTFVMFSMAGIPPLAGFYSKAFLFFAAMSSNMYVCAFIGVLTSVVSCYYYIRIVKIMYFETPPIFCSFSQIPKQNAFVLSAGSVFILFFIMYPSPLYLLTHKIACLLCV